MESGAYICNIKNELGTCGRLPICLLSTRNALLGQTSGPASPVCLSPWQKGWCLGEGGSLASPPASPFTHRRYFEDVRSLPSHLWTCCPWVCPNCSEPAGAACLPSLAGQRVPGVHHLLCKEILFFISYKSTSYSFHQAHLALVLQDLMNSNSTSNLSITFLILQTTYSPHSLQLSKVKSQTF